MIRIPILASVLIFITSCCCCCSLEGILQGQNGDNSVSAEEFSREIGALPPEVENFQAVRYDFPGFTNYYLRYEVSDPQIILAWVESLPAAPSAEIAPEQMVCQPSDEQWIGQDFSPQVDELKQVAFWHPEQVTRKEYHACLRFPWSHSLLFDLDGKTVYHVIQEIRD